MLILENLQNTTTIDAAEVCLMAAIEVLSLSCRNSLNGENLSKFQCFRSQFCASWWSCKRPLSSQVKRHQVGLLKANLKCRQIADNRQGKGGLKLNNTSLFHLFSNAFLDGKQIS